MGSAGFMPGLFGHEGQRICRWLTVVIGFLGGLAVCSYATRVALHVDHGINPQTPEGAPIPDGILAIEAMMVAAVLWCIGTWNLARLWYEPLPPLSPSYVLAARIVRSLLVLVVSATALGIGAFISFPISRSSLPLFGVGIMLFGAFGLYTIYRDWRHGDRPAGFQKD
jgi:hypothetical protein